MMACIVERSEGMNDGDRKGNIGVDIKENTAGLKSENGNADNLSQEKAIEQYNVDAKWLARNFDYSRKITLIETIRTIEKRHGYKFRSLDWQYDDSASRIAINGPLVGGIKIVILSDRTFKWIKVVDN